MEAAAKDNDIEMARGTSAADSEPNNCSNSEFEKQEAMMASSSNNQGKSNDGKSNFPDIFNTEDDKARENELVAATLIATVSFAAGFTVPGGFVADKGPDQGAAILRRNTAFRAFVILNTMSMYFSCQAVMLCLLKLSFVPIIDLPRFRKALISFAMLAMIGAFLSATCAMLHNDKNLAISACVMPFVIFSFFQLLFMSRVYILIYNSLKERVSRYI